MGKSTCTSNKNRQEILSIAAVEDDPVKEEEAEVSQT